MKAATARKPLIRIAVVESDPLRFVGFRALFDTEMDFELISATLAELSEKRARQLLKLAGITDSAQLAFCLSKAKEVLPLDLLLLAYLLKNAKASNDVDYERIEHTYLQIEPLLRK